MGDSRHVFRGVDAGEIKARRVLEPGDGFLQIFRVEVERVIGRVDVIDGPHGEFEVSWKDASLKEDPIADLPAVLLGEGRIHHSARAILLPGLELLGWHLLVGRHHFIFFGVSRELGEEIFRLIVFILAA